MINRDQYLTLREFFQNKGREAGEAEDLNEANYCSGVIRGLDLAFQEGSADPEGPRRPVRD